MARYVVATVSEIKPGDRKIVEVAGRSIGIFNIRGEFFALRNRCPHQGGPLCTGRLAGFLTASVPGEYRYSRQGEILRCPWHGWEFDVRTGQSWFDPTHTRVRSYEARVEPGSVLVQEIETAPAGLQKGPYVAETYSVSIEEEYVVVDVPN
ncbi:MAG TPA: Rieske (2Fe-2S) protein [Chloroflexota bacterium]|jgi:nitrite reductase/ring-hydroxylating ferredoxin subunit|nr:Rieske (2Fe-2S) protein [Chloroflexota bacterium]